MGSTLADPTGLLAGFSRGGPPATGAIEDVFIVGEARILAGVVSERLRVPQGAEVFVGGWVAIAPPATRGNRVVLSVGGQATHPARFGASRDAASSGGNAARRGFWGIVPTGALEPGRYELGAHVLHAAKVTFADLPQRRFIEVVAASELVPNLPSPPTPRMRLQLDEIAVTRPRDEQSADPTFGSIAIRGWACDEYLGEPVSDLFAVPEGANAVRATIGFPRPDVAAALGRDECLPCGFLLRIPLRAAQLPTLGVSFACVSADRQFVERLGRDLVVVDAP